MSAVAASPAATGRTLRRWRELSAVRSMEVALLTIAGGTGIAGVMTFVLREDLLAPFPGNTPFAFNVGLAICAITAGVALDGHRASRALGVFTAVLGALTLFEHISGTDLGIGRVLFDPFTETSVGRMAPNTAICVTLAGLALATRGRVSTLLAVVPALIGLMAGLGYTDPDAKALASIGQSVNMSLPTAVGISTSCLALVLAREYEYFTRATGGGTITRRLGLLVLVLPAAGGTALVAGIRNDVFSASTGIWLLTVSAVFVAVAALIWVADVVDREEDTTHSALALQTETSANLSEGLCLRRESDGKILSVNPALKEMFGYRAGELTGTTRRLLTDENERRMQQELRRAGGWTAEVETVRADGSRFWCSVKASTFEDPKHGLMRVALYHDVTERREAEINRREAEKRSSAALAELERSNAELEQFAHVASHDLSEPLRVVGGFVGLLQRRYEGQLDEDADRFIEATVSGVERMQALIDALLAYSRVGSDELEPEPVDIGAVAAEAVRVQGTRLQDGGGQVHIGHMPTVPGDPLLLERVFQNLISNAIKFAREGVPPRVSIEAERSDFGVWHFQVADNGVGIPPEHAERVFGMFQRLQGREMEGTGIGLSITRRIIERHGGRIWAEPGDGGTVFHFTLPQERS
ncbi:MAG TPA: ATP-binding protein [Thermoleophilaceae bacterium]|nr:ATP-binding protein [Thermoleophilaceae bacterium]